MTAGAILSIIIGVALANGVLLCGLSACARKTPEPQETDGDVELLTHIADLQAELEDMRYRMDVLHIRDLRLRNAWLHAQHQLRTIAKLAGEPSAATLDRLYGRVVEARK